MTWLPSPARVVAGVVAWASATLAAIVASLAALVASLTPSAVVAAAAQWHRFAAALVSWNVKHAGRAVPPTVVPTFAATSGGAVGRARSASGSSIGSGTSAGGADAGDGKECAGFFTHARAASVVEALAQPVLRTVATAWWSVNASDAELATALEERSATLKREANALEQLRRNLLALPALHAHAEGGQHGGGGMPGAGGGRGAAASSSWVLTGAHAAAAASYVRDRARATLSDASASRVTSGARSSSETVVSSLWWAVMTTTVSVRIAAAQLSAHIKHLTAATMGALQVYRMPFASAAPSSPSERTGAGAGAVDERNPDERGHPSAAAPYRPLPCDDTPSKQFDRDASSRPKAFTRAPPHFPALASRGPSSVGANPGLSGDIVSEDASASSTASAQHRHNGAVAASHSTWTPRTHSGASGVPVVSAARSHGGVSQAPRAAVGAPPTEPAATTTNRFAVAPAAAPAPALRSTPVAPAPKAAAKKPFASLSNVVDHKLAGRHWARSHSRRRHMRATPQ